MDSEDYASDENVGDSEIKIGSWVLVMYLKKKC